MRRPSPDGSLGERLTARWLGHRPPPSVPLDMFGCLRDARRILVAPNDRVGGLFFGGPVCKLLRQQYRDAHVTLLVSAQRSTLARQIPFSDDVVEVDLGRPVWSPSFRQGLDAVRHRSYDLVLCLGVDCSFRLAYVCQHSGARLRIGFQRAGSALQPFNMQIVPANPTGYEADQYARLLHMLGIGGDPAVRWSLDAARVQQMRARYLGTDESARVIGVDLTGGEGPGLRRRQVDDIIGRVVERGARALLFYSAAERKVVAALATTYGARVIPFEEQDLASVGLLLPSCQTLIACNTEVLHMGMALQVPVVGLFEEEPQRWVQYGNDRVKVIHVDDVRALSITQVGRALDEVLNDRRYRHRRVSAPRRR